MPGQQMGKLHFKFLTGDMNWKTYGGTFVSKRMNNGDWDFWALLEVINTEDCGSDFKTRYIVTLSAVSPQAAGPDELKRAMECCGFDTDPLPDEALMQVEALHTYGVKAVLFEASGNNLKKLLHEAHKQAIPIFGLFGFAMDRPQNRIGADGWDCIAGNVWGPLKPELSAKAHGQTED